MATEQARPTAVEPSTIRAIGHSCDLGARSCWSRTVDDFVRMAKAEIRRKSVGAKPDALIEPARRREACASRRARCPSSRPMQQLATKGGWNAPPTSCRRPRRTWRPCRAGSRCRPEVPADHDEPRLRRRPPRRRRRPLGSSPAAPCRKRRPTSGVTREASRPHSLPPVSSPPCWPASWSAPVDARAQSLEGRPMRPGRAEHDAGRARGRRHRRAPGRRAAARRGLSRRRWQAGRSSATTSTASGRRSSCSRTTRAPCSAASCSTLTVRR